MPTPVIDLIPNKRVAENLNVSEMTLWRYDHDDDLIAAGWPPPIYIRRKKFRDGTKLEAFKAAMVRRTIGA